MSEVWLLCGKKFYPSITSFDFIILEAFEQKKMFLLRPYVRDTCRRKEGLHFLNKFSFASKKHEN